MSDGLSFDLHVPYGAFELAAAAEIPRDGITVISGPSGSGKTTLLRAIAGLEPRAEGRVAFAGTDWSALRPEARGIGYVFQETRLFPHLNVAANLNYGARRRGSSPTQVEAVIQALDLKDLLKRGPATLSGGEARRVELGRALAAGPQVLLLDEPLTGLERARKDALIPYIARAVSAFGLPALYVTHSAYEIDALADRVLLLESGRIAGRRPAPPRLTGRIVEVQGRLCVELGDERYPLAVTGAPGSCWVMPLGDSYSLSADPPGRGTADLTLPVRLHSHDPHGGLQIEAAGQRLSVDRSLPANGDWRHGMRLWLTLPNAKGYPV